MIFELYISLYSLCPPSLQRADVHLHDRRQPALHAAHQLAAHRRLHPAGGGAPQASDGGRRGDPEPRHGGERGGRAGRAHAGHQAAQDR